MTASPNRIDCGDGVTLERGLRCRMSDGVHLVSDHYYPPSTGAPAQHPTLLMRQPYGRDIASTVVYAHPAWFARQGYLVVIQDVRGRGDSEGEFYPFRQEGADGAETIAWLCARPESNGRLGMYGFSYQGMTQLLAAARQPPGLQAIAPAMCACDLYQGWFYHGGALRLAGTLGWGLQLLKADARRLRLARASEALERAWANLGSQPHHLPYGQHPALHGEGLPSYVLDWLAHPEPGSYWDSLDIHTSLHHIQVPALHLSGWRDPFVKGTIDGFLALSDRAGTDAARTHQYLVAGPWVHIPWGDSAGPEAFGPEALLDTDQLLLRWFNHWLKDTGEFAREPRIRHFALGENRWHVANTWGASTEPLRLHLHSGGRANSRKGDGTLSPAAPLAAQPPDLFVHDPEVPVLASSGGGDQSQPELGNNMLVYTSAALTQPIHVFGYPRLILYASASATHTDFTGRLVCVAADARAHSVCIGILRSGPHVRPDVPSRWEIELEPTSFCFQPGERIRLEVASSAFPLYDKNPGTGVEPAQATSWDWRRSTQIVHHDPQHLSLLLLPVLPRSA
ncbi:MAG TPA: CocE/NonD family hydrolase [Acidobacteriaceae bacterium]